MLLGSTLRSLDRIGAKLDRAPERAPHLVSGYRGEEGLRKLGFAVQARDHRFPRRRGDLNLIAWEKDTLCFLEVKTRSRRDSMPAEAVIDQGSGEAGDALRPGARISAPSLPFPIQPSRLSLRCN